MTRSTMIHEQPKRTGARHWLWRFVGRVWSPKNWNGDALHYVREWYPERLLLHEIFEGKRRFLKLEWWWTKLVCLTLPPNIAGLPRAGNAAAPTPSTQSNP